MPLIRYRTGDLGVWSHYPCTCGRGHPIMSSIQGRTREFVVDQEGRRHIPQVYGSLWRNPDAIRQVQFRQSVPGELVIVVVAGEVSDVRHYIEDALTGEVREKFDLVVEEADEIPRTGVGKHNFLVQEL